ncbi:hypothetical protein [Janthinobacterium psychrotolerans]|uniref:Uncharacterized protein n=1 Tax=Janthinobacterium psychrotolerans TaxID=1747903 RepID=A0A1A7C327_9BURK|nr:hypothetical protein [Janthinobacterium psychrotolerans]OBV40346.1 hypothetical protein ASR47_1015105 [Janthinobacterium psychrotolerans]
MFFPRHPKPLLSTKAVATMMVQQRQRTPAIDKHVLIVENAKPLLAPVAPVKKD